MIVDAQNASNQMPLLYALRRVRFCIDDLLDTTRARKLRERLVENDKLELAKRVWEECEGLDGNDFDKGIKRQLSDLKADCEKFDEINSRSSGYDANDDDV